MITTRTMAVEAHSPLPKTILVLSPIQPESSPKTKPRTLAARGPIKWGISGCRARSIRRGITDPASLALRANAAHCETGPDEVKSKSCAGFQSCIQNSFTFKVLCASASHANEVVMADVFGVSEFEPTAVTGFQFLEKPHLHQQSQCAVNRGKRYL